MRRIVTLLACAVFLAACSNTSGKPTSSNSPTTSSSASPVVTASDYFNRLEQAQQSEPIAEKSYVTCSSENITVQYLNKIILQAADVDEVYMIVTAACVAGDQKSAERVEVLRWSAEISEWSPVGTVRLSNKNYMIPWNTESACFEENGAVICPVFVTKENGKTRNGTLTVTRERDHFWAEINY
jgi:ABC-type glycerol-3-phosphate transport system substrate-binding protein